MAGSKRTYAATVALLCLLTAPATRAAEYDQAQPYADMPQKEAAAKNPCEPEENYYHDRDRGWYHREQCIEEKKKEDKKQARSKPKKLEKPEIDWKHVTDPEYLASITAEDFRKLLTTVKDEAVYNPTPEKVHVYMQLQDYARRKSVEFAYVWRDVLLKNPSIDMTATYPANNYGAFAQERMKTKTNEETMALIRERAALLLFVSAECPYCWDQVRAMEAVANKYSLVYKIYTKDYCPEKFKYCEPGQQMFQKFNVQVTPSVVAVYRDPQDKPVFQPISNGLVMAEDLIEKLVFYYNYVTTGEHPSS